MWRKKENQATTLSIAYYHLLVQQARQEWFYNKLEVLDSPLGRFEILTLHLFILLRRLKTEKLPLAKDISQLISEFLVADLHESLRHLQISDSKVAKLFNKLIQGFYGRLIAYDKAYEESSDSLCQAIHRNVYEENSGKKIYGEELAAYTIHQIENLQEQVITQLRFKEA